MEESQVKRDQEESGYQVIIEVEVYCKQISQEDLEEEPTEDELTQEHPLRQYHKRSYPSAQMINRKYKRGKRKPVLGIEEQSLVDRVREHGILFNSRSPGYKDTVKKEACLEERAARMNQEPEEFRHCFAMQRTLFGKFTIGKLSQETQEL